MGVSRNSLARMDTLLATPPLPEPPASAAAKPEGADIVFDAVSFAYRDEPVLDDSWAICRTRSPRSASKPVPCCNGFEKLDAPFLGFVHFARIYDAVR